MLSEYEFEKSRHKWIILGIGVFSQAIFSFAYAGIPITGVIMQKEYNFSIYHLGLVLGCMGLGVALSELLWGLLTDKFGDRRVLIFGLSTMGMVFTFMAFYLVPAMGFKPNYIQLGIALL
ncbi:MFS transporter [Fluviispira vulneris]|uniref:MFS transporter n=1 Tax=Fluviispira vulneris TaxID=2763012 RepID=UPI001646E930|nr:MFS transporter [Fluviispira vulneris]